MAGGGKMPPSTINNGSKRGSPLKQALGGKDEGPNGGVGGGDLVGGLLTGAGPPPGFLDETSRPPDTSAAMGRAIFTPVVMNQHGARVCVCGWLPLLCLHTPSIIESSPVPIYVTHAGGSNWGGIQVRVRKSAVKRAHDAAALAALSNALPMNEGEFTESGSTRRSHAIS